MKSRERCHIVLSSPVAPLAGAWIEIIRELVHCSNSTSLPSRERGLKSNGCPETIPSCVVAPLAGAWIEIMLISFLLLRRKVAPLAGAWIEISAKAYRNICLSVAPLAGAWIEILLYSSTSLGVASLPSRERGLKSESLFDKLTPDEVAPLAGAWIEIYHVLLRISNRRSRSPRGSVD